MIISHKYKYIFIKNKKVAGTSIELYLNRFKGKTDVFTPINPPLENYIAQNYKGLYKPLKEIKEHNYSIRSFQLFLFERAKYWNHISASKIRDRTPKNVWKNYFKFCVERNPWEKCISGYSMWNHFSGGNYSFDDYLNFGPIPINIHRYTIDGELSVDYVVQYENLEEELGRIFNKLGIPYEGKLRIWAKSNYRKDKRDYRKILTEQQIKRVAKIFEKEIKLLGIYNS